VDNTTILFITDWNLCVIIGKLMLKIPTGRAQPAQQIHIATMTERMKKAKKIWNMLREIVGEKPEGAIQAIIEMSSWSH
jgi:hypothetical protein